MSSKEEISPTPESPSSAPDIRDFLRGDTSFTTFTGRQFDPFDPQPEDIHILDIAHALSNTCRYGGMCQFYYSVAQHSGYVAQMAMDLNGTKTSPDWPLWGLLHDAAEAYIGDMPTPFKPFMTNFDKVETDILRVIAEKFGLHWYGEAGVPDAIKKVDKRMLFTEARQLLPGADWCKYQPKWPETAGYDMMVQPMSPIAAEDAFLRTFGNLYYRR